MTPDECNHVIAGNIRAERARVFYQQEYVAMRMRELGHTSWLRQTVANVEGSKRRIQANEVISLSEILDVPVATLMGRP
jgi:hypothetical protein